MLETITDAVISSAAGQGQVMRATILIDGLQKTLRQEVASSLRTRLPRPQIQIEKVRGLDEHSDPLMRLADALAEFVRHALEGRPDMAQLLTENHRRGVVQLLQT